jgi:hypothetical protein
VVGNRKNRGMAHSVPFLEDTIFFGLPPYNIPF